jgi:glycosyltransferase involved in cell wall biosynthesis
VRNARILEVVNGFPPASLGGVQVLTYNLAKELARRHEVHVFYPIYRKGSGRCWVNSFKKGKENIVIHELTIEESIWNYLKRLLSFDLVELSCKNKRIRERFEECLEEIQPDVVHFQHLKGLSIDLPFVAKKHSRVVLGLNDYWLMCPTTHFLNSDGKICARACPENCLRCLSTSWSSLISLISGQLPIHAVLKKAYGRYCVKKIADRRIYVKRCLECADKLIAPSETLIMKFRENGFIDEKIQDGKVVLIYHGVDTASLNKVKRNSSEKTRFGYVGGSSERKGLYVLIDAFNKLGDVNAELKIYGTSLLEASTQHYKCLIKRSEDNSRIRFMDRFEDIREPYSNIDVLVVPSVTYEGYGLVVQEAFAAKTPVIVSNIGALNEFVEHMKNGLLFEAGNSNDLARRMRTIIENPLLLHKLVRNMPQVKSLEQNAFEIEEVYKEVISRLEK